MRLQKEVCGETKIPVSDQAIEYYMVRADLIKRQLAAAGHGPEDLTSEKTMR